MMRKDKLITVNSKTSEVFFDNGVLGIDGENLQGNLIFSFNDEFVDGTARVEIEINGTKSYTMLTKEDETYTLPIKSFLTKVGRVDLELVITEGTNVEEIPIFKSKIFYLIVHKSIDAKIEQPEEYDQWIDVANEKLNEIDDAIDRAGTLDVDAEKVDTTTTITITKQDGTTKEVEIEDGVDGQDGKDGEDGKDATINGVNTLTLEAGDNIELEQEGSTLTISATGGGGGTSDYTDLTNKPKINNVELNGNKTTSDLNISYNDLTNKPTIPTVPTNVSAFTNDAGYTTNTGTITSVKMNGTTISSSGEADLGTVITDISSKQDTLVSGTNIKTINNTSILGSGNIDTEIIQYSTMPTASSSNVGSIVQFVGTTDTNYTNGYFYKCVEDDSVYSWENVEVQQASGGDSQTSFVFTYGEASATSIATAQKIIDYYKTYNVMPLIYYRTTTNTSYGGYNMLYTLMLQGYSNRTYKFSVYKLQSPENQYTGAGYVYFVGMLYIYLAQDETTVSGVSIPEGTYSGSNKAYRSYEIPILYKQCSNNQSANSYVDAKSVLPINNYEAYTPTGDYNPSTKKYVDDSISSAIGSINTILATLTTPSSNNGGGN